MFLFQQKIDSISLQKIHQDVKHLNKFNHIYKKIYIYNITITVLSLQCYKKSNYYIECLLD